MAAPKKPKVSPNLLPAVPKVVSSLIDGAGPLGLILKPQLDYYNIARSMRDVGQADNLSKLDWGSVADLAATAIPGGVGKATGVTGAGLKALSQTAKAVKRSAAEDALKAVSQNLAVRGNSASLHGPGSYFATDMGSSVNRWREYGNNLSGIATTPSAKLDIARSQGYASPDLVKQRISELSPAGTDITNAQISDPAIQSLLKEGYIGVHNPAEGVLTSWKLGDAKGMTSKPLGKLNPATQTWENPSTLGQRTYNYVRNLSPDKNALSYMKNNDILKRVVQSKKDALNISKKLKDQKAQKAFESKPQIEG